MRKLKKSMFGGQLQCMEEYRYILEELINVEHPNLAQIIDFKEDSNNFFILQEFCKGG
jgi:hypothetical protein